MNDALADLVEAEARGGLWEQRVLNYPVWPLLRLARYRSALLCGETTLPRERAPGQPPSWQRLIEAVRDVARQGLPHADARDVWVLSSSTYRRRAADGSYPCIFAAHLQAQLGDRLRFVEVNAAGLPLAGRADVFLLDRYVDAIQVLAARAGRQAAGALVPERVVGAFAPIPRAALVRWAVYGRLLQQLGAALLCRGRPRAVFVLCGYASLIPLQRAVRAAGIPLIELQHGVIHESHPGYVFGPDVPDRDHRPDHLVLFGDHFGRLLDRASPGLRTPWSVGGHPWLNRVRRGLARSDGGGTPTVVVFGQYDPPVQAQLKAFVPELRRLLPVKVELIYKPHPREPTDDLAAAFREASVTLADPVDDAYALLSRCTAAVSVYSTLAIEALAFPCQSVVIRSPHWTEDIQHFVSQGVLLVADRPADIVQLLRAPPADPGAVADALFGTSTPEPDFTALIDQVTRTRRLRGNLSEA